ncbi:MAG: crossover junction endodeoxyribonuclease RuvC [Desulfobulbaceae bacterium]|nr:crossover junction endodeoxyribonuclease RuvC [Desulfobulbaceae bacterium]
MRRILGIDPGSRVTGYGVIDAAPGRLSFVACGVIRVTDQETFVARLDAIFSGINEVIQIHQPDVVAIEEVFLAENPRSALKLGHARGAAVVAATQNGLAVHEYNAKTIKRAVTGYGQAEKQQVQHMVRALLGLNACPSSDAADGLAVAICHANQCDFGVLA